MYAAHLPEGFTVKREKKATKKEMERLLAQFPGDHRFTSRTLRGVTMNNGALGHVETIFDDRGTPLFQIWLANDRSFGGNYLVVPKTPKS